MNEWERAFGALYGLEKLEDDWDGEGAPPIDKRAISAATTTLIVDWRLGAHAPMVAPTTSGGVSLSWERRWLIIGPDGKSFAEVLYSDGKPQRREWSTV